MWSKTSGYFLIELLLSLSTLLMIAMFFVPIAFQLSQQLQQIQVQKQANQLLYEELEAYLAGNHAMVNHSVLLQSREYIITWQGNEVLASLEVCVYVEKKDKQISPIQCKEVE